MPIQKLTKMALMIQVIGLVLFFLLLENAHSVPSFESQTGMECTTCHTIFPELKPFGRIFKLGGYVFSKSSKPYEFPPPVAGMAQLSFTHTNKAQPRGFIDENWATHVTSTGNDVLSLPQQASVFYGGRIFEKVGGFVQGTFDGASKNAFLDNTDIRYANSTTMLGENLMYGLTVNNNPTVQDVWNTTPAWGFPYASSSVAPTPAAGTVIDGVLSQQVGGIGAYGFWNNLIYAEGTVYRTARNGITEPFGAGTTTDTVVSGIVPYWRLALQQQWKEHFLSAGTYGIVARIFPGGLRHGPTDRFTDIAFDAQYQYIGTKHMVSAHATWIHEKQDWNASFALGNTGNRSDSLKTFRINATYYYSGEIGFMDMGSGSMKMSHMGFIGGSLGYFSTTGRKDTVLYSPGPVNGSRTGSPNSNGFILELDYLPWHKAKVSLQYTLYHKFNGSHSNYDGFGRDAFDNNTLYFLLWFMF
jgi:hypothetical protein